MPWGAHSTFSRNRLGTLTCMPTRQDAVPSFLVNTHRGAEHQLLLKQIDKRCRLKGSGTTSVKRSRLVIGGRFEYLEDLSHFLAPLVGVGAVHPAGCQF